MSRLAVEQVRDGCLQEPKLFPHEAINTFSLHRATNTFIRSVSTGFSQAGLGSCEHMTVCIWVGLTQSSMEILRTFSELSQADEPQIAQNQVLRAPGRPEGRLTGDPQL